VEARSHTPELFASVQYGHHRSQLYLALCKTSDDAPRPDTAASARLVENRKALG
jgi:hypothetical protein